MTNNRPNIFVPWCLLASFFLLMLAGCKPGVPGKVLSPRKMEAILYDYHVAKAMSDIDEDFNDTLRMSVYRKAILKKHGVTEAEYDSAMVYYMRHTRHLKTIYDHLAERFDADAKAMGAVVGGNAQYTALSVNGDTANIWSADRSIVLTQQPAFNSYSFSMEADSTFRPGDRFVFSFNSNFMFQDGTRDAIASLAIKLANDSVVSRMVRMSSSTDYRIDVSDVGEVGIKSIYGYFVLNRRILGEPDSRTTIKLLHVGDIKLIRMHQTEQKELSSKINTEPIRTDSDSMRMRRPLRINADSALKRNVNRVPEAPTR
ncbi:MAG: DUF4296 domain-containing protein [Prevotella sp.]|nr:DUF4296 domain-containing protein [Prevotella sp.]